MKKKLLVCPNCELNGKKEVLGEVIDNKVVVRRFGDRSTVINALEFSVECGSCREIVFVKLRR